MVVELLDGLGEPVVNEQLVYTLVDGNAQVGVKIVATVSPQEVRVPTDFLGRAAVNMRFFSADTAKVDVSVVSRPALTLRFTQYAH